MVSKFPHLRRWLLPSTHARELSAQTSAAEPDATLPHEACDLASRYQRLLEAQQLAGLGHWHCETPASAAMLCATCLHLLGLPQTSRAVGFGGICRRIHRQDRGILMARTNQALSDASGFEAEIRVRTGDGGLRWVHLLGRIVRGEDGAVLRMHGTATDITRRRVLQDQIQHIALHDGLTGLPNRTMFQHHFTHALLQARRYCKKLALLFIDLDRFKEVNDSLGHEAGDRVLQEVARRLSASLRRADLVARIGGDEFVVLLEEITGLEQVTQVARQIQAAMAPECMIAGRRLSLAASIGISMFPDAGDDATTLLRHADVAMYAAKRHGRSCVQYHPALHGHE